MNEYLTFQFFSQHCRLFVDEIAASGSNGKTMPSQQMTLWLQSLFLFSAVWSLGGTITGDSRAKFDVFYRHLVKGMNDEHPQPESIKLNKNMFPEGGKKKKNQPYLCNC